MKNHFERIATGLDVAPLLTAIDSMPELWREITLRQEYPNGAHHDTETIFLRGPKTLTPQDYFFDLGACDYPAMSKLNNVVIPLLLPVLIDLDVTELGRILIVKLNPDGVVDAHIDEGLYADHFARFHIALQGEEGSTLTVGDETQHFAPGEAWRLDHKIIHCAANNAKTPRIHLIFDAVTPLYPMGGMNEPA